MLLDFIPSGFKLLGFKFVELQGKNWYQLFLFFFLKFLLSTTDVNGRPLNRTVVFRVSEENVVRFKSLSSVHSPRFVGISWILGSSFGSMEGLRSLMPQILIRPSFRRRLGLLIL
ncbi:BnaA10g06270D [Brassica napus]|uniref:BnaA10g06270D protein n=1 Tax=Brassica napus TaxID=3708 RepID=A0A078IJA9_BRANA|nr:BnaA10g06270D [Brassica napus]